MDEHQRRLRLLLVRLLGGREEVVEHPGQRVAAAVAVVHRDQHLHRHRRRSLLSLSLSDSGEAFLRLLDGVVDVIDMYSYIYIYIYTTGAVRSQWIDPIDRRERGSDACAGTRHVRVITSRSCLPCRHTGHAN